MMSHRINHSDILLIKLLNIKRQFGRENHLQQSNMHIEMLTVFQCFHNNK